MSEVRDAVDLEAGMILAGRVNQATGDGTPWVSNGDAVVWRAADTWFS